MQIAEQSDIDLKGEFNRTGLPRGSLARYLGVENAVISRALGGQRALSADQERDAAAFFSVVPPDADAEFVSAVRRLRTPAIRSRVIARLGEWLRRNGARPVGDGHPFDHFLLGGADLRADQIVAVARSEALDLARLVFEGEARPAASQSA